MQFKKTFTGLALAMAITIPSVSSAMTTDVTSDPFRPLSILLDIAESVLDNALSSVSAEAPLTSLTSASKDANKDGKVDRKDLLYIQEAISSTSTSNFKGADVNGDGKISNNDVIFLRDYFKGNKDYVNAYDMDTIGSGWSVVPADGKVDSKDVGTVMFAKAVYEKDATKYQILFDLNYDGKIDQKDITILEDYIKAKDVKSADVKSKDVTSKPPVITESYPQGEQSALLAQIYLSAVTDVPALCSYSSNKDDSYESMKQMEHTALGETKTYHAQLITKQKKNVDLTFYIKCKSLAGGVMEEAKEVKFSFGPTEQAKAAPSIIASYPNKSLVSTTKEYFLRVTTDMPAKCRYTLEDEFSYGDMKEMTYTAMGADKNNHFQLVAGLEPGDRKSVAVLCESFENKVAEKPYFIQIIVEGVKTATTEELQKMVDQLLKQVQELQSI